MRTSFTTALLSFSLVALVATPVAAAESDAQAVVSNYMKSWKADGLPATAVFFDPKGIEEVSEMMKPLLEMNDSKDGNPMRQMLRGPEFSAADVAKLKSTEVFAMVLEMTEGAMQRQGGATLETYKVLGAVPESDELVHVVARATMKYRDTEVEQVNLISTQKRDGKWTIAMRPDLKQMVAGLRQQLVAGMAQQAKQDASR
ncbi:MAG: hypothetical protein ACI8TX_000251 [Hyphomicrobiaceae bacterium]|jgi:hypothetical protein